MDTDGNDLVDQAQQKVGQVAGQVQEKAGEVVDQVRHQARSRLDSQKDMAAGTIWSLARAIRQTGDSLREQDQQPVAQLADKAAEQVERVSSYLGHRDVNQIINEVQHFARRQPAVFLGSAFALGMLGARFLKSSNQSAQSTQGGDYTNHSYKVGGNWSDNYSQTTQGVGGQDWDGGGWSDGAYIEPASDFTSPAVMSSLSDTTYDQSEDASSYSILADDMDTDTSESYSSSLDSASIGDETSQEEDSTANRFTPYLPDAEA